VPTTKLGIYCLGAQKPRFTRATDAQKLQRGDVSPFYNPRVPDIYAFRG
jgi:hypothetical protein